MYCTVESQTISCSFSESSLHFISLLTVYRGCSVLLQDMCWHHRMCPYANYPHPNVLPSMPTRKKSSRSTGPHSPTSSASSADKINGNGNCPAADSRNISRASNNSSNSNGLLLCGPEALDGNGVGSNGKNHGAVPTGEDGESQPPGATTATAAAIAAAAAKMLEDSTTQTEIKLFPGILSRKGHE